MLDVRLALTTAILVVATTVGSSDAGAASTSTFARQSGSAILATAMKTARAEGSCSASSTTRISGQTYSSRTESAAASGQQSQQVGGARSTVRMVDGVIYLYDNAEAMADQFGVSPRRDVDQWIAIDRTNPEYRSFDDGVLLGSLLSEIAPSGALTTTPSTTLAGVAVVGVTGRPNVRLGLASGTETLYVSATAAHVPVEIVAVSLVQGQRRRLVITFSQWGTNFHLTTPPGAITFAASKLAS